MTAQAAASESELFIALVAAVGTDVGMVGDQIAVELDTYGFSVDPLRLSDYLEAMADESFRGKPRDEELWDAMSVGDDLRQDWERSDALALHAISHISAIRDERAGEIPDDQLAPPLQRHAFILRSLKTPDELETLRAVYGPRLIVVAAYSPRDKRVEQLAREIEDSRGSGVRENWAHQPEELIARDEKEEAQRGQNVSDTFHRADFFIRASSRDEAREDIARSLEILFGAPFRTPTCDEHGQFIAAGAALRSAEFSRQVGAALTTADGSLIAVGSNEVPVASGGSHWEGRGTGNRDFEIGDIDTNRKNFDELAEKLAGHVDGRAAALLEAIADEFPDAREALDDARAQLRDKLPADLRDAGLKDLTEFGRAVHAEMNAILDAARRGVPVGEATLYTTTFPCHNCARHVIGAGIARVVFVEPYPKSRAQDLHGDAIATSDDEDGDVAFVPFVGVAPRRYLELFDAAARARIGHIARKDSTGHKIPFDRHAALPVFADGGLSQFRPALREYRAKELVALAHFEQHAASSGRSVRATLDTSPPAG
jgi:deoxycytidylate deaminase